MLGSSKNNFLSFYVKLININIYVILNRYYSIPPLTTILVRLSEVWNSRAWNKKYPLDGLKLIRGPILKKYNNFQTN